MTTPFIATLQTIALALALTTAALAADSPAQSLQTGFVAEDLNRNLDDAIRAYRLAVDAFDAQRPAAATALYRLGECYRKLGRTNDAVAQYRRLLAQFPDQVQLAGLCQTNLITFGLTPTAPAAPSLPPAALRQKELLEQELALVDQQLANKRLQVEGGRISRDELLALQRDSLSLQRQVAEVESKYRRDLRDVLEIGLPSPGTTPTPALDSPPTPDPREVASLQQELELVKKDLAATKARLAVGKADSTEVASAEREVLKVQRQLPENANPARQKTLLTNEIALVQLTLNSVQRAIAAGVQPPLAELRVQRDLLALQRELSALDRRSPNRPSTAVTTPARNTPPLSASEAAEIERLTELLRNSPDLLNAAGKGGLTPLEAAAEEGQVAVVRFLLDNGAEIDGLGTDSLTALHHAAMRGHKAVVDHLLLQGANVDGGSRPSVTPLHLAAIGGHRAVIQSLLGAKPNLNAAANSGTPATTLRIETGYAPLHLAVLRGSLPVVEALLNAGANPNIPQATAAGWTPLYLACIKADREIVDALLRAKADVNAGSADGRTPLHSAIDNRRPDLIPLLLDHQADPNRPAANGWRPLHTAAVSHSPETLDALLKAHPDLDATTTEGWSPLHLALGARTRRDSSDDADPRIVTALLAAGASPNLPTPQRLSPLHLAVDRNAPDLLNILLAHKPNLAPRDSEGFTPLHRAVLTERPDLVRPLLAAGADPNSPKLETPDVAGDCPLHWAVQMSNATLLELLLEFKANPNVLNARGQSPLSIALDRASSIFSAAINRPPGNRYAAPAEIADLLRRAGADDSLHLRNTLTVRRGTATHILLRRQDNDLNRFTLLEAVAMLYGLSESEPAGGATPGAWTFPDLARVTLSSRTEVGLKETPIDLGAILESGDLSRDLPLEWGDTLEIPEADHPVNYGWGGFSQKALDTFARRLTRTVTVSVKDQTKTLNLVVTNSTGLKRLGSHMALPVFCPSQGAFWLKGTIDASRLVRTSSDLHHVQVKRTDPKTGQTQNLVFDLEPAAPPPRSIRSPSIPQPSPVPNTAHTSPPPPQADPHAPRTTPLWLQDGDTITIPEKP